MVHCGWLQLCNTVAIGMMITIFWIHYGVKRYHYNRLIGIREFLELIAVD